LNCQKTKKQKKPAYQKKTKQKNLGPRVVEGLVGEPVNAWRHNRDRVDTLAVADVQELGLAAADVSQQ
jgi:hypothetical protein